MGTTAASVWLISGSPESEKQIKTQNTGVFFYDKSEPASRRKRNSKKAALNEAAFFLRIARRGSIDISCSFPVFWVRQSRHFRLHSLHKPKLQRHYIILSLPAYAKSFKKDIFFNFIIIETMFAANNSVSRKSFGTHHGGIKISQLFSLIQKLPAKSISLCGELFAFRLYGHR